MKNLSCFLNEPTQWDGNSQDRQLVPVLNAYLSCIKKSGPLRLCFSMNLSSRNWLHMSAQKKIDFIFWIGMQTLDKLLRSCKILPSRVSLLLSLVFFFFLGEILQLLDFGVIIRRRGIVWKIWLRYTRRYLFEKFCFILIFFLLNPEI